MKSLSESRRLTMQMSARIEAYMREYEDRTDKILFTTNGELSEFAEGLAKALFMPKIDREEKQ